MLLKFEKNKDFKGIHFIDGEKNLFACRWYFINIGCQWKIFTKSNLDILRDFAKVSGLNKKLQKTQVIWIGCKEQCEYSICTNDALEWGKKTFILLGIEFDTNLLKVLMWISGSAAIKL